MKLLARLAAFAAIFVTYAAVFGYAAFGLAFFLTPVDTTPLGALRLLWQSVSG